MRNILKFIQWMTVAVIADGFQKKIKKFESREDF